MLPKLIVMCFSNLALKSYSTFSEAAWMTTRGGPKRGESALQTHAHMHRVLRRISHGRQTPCDQFVRLKHALPLAKQGYEFDWCSPSSEPDGEVARDAAEAASISFGGLTLLSAVITLPQRISGPLGSTWDVFCAPMF